MVKLYRGTTSKDRRLRMLRSGYIPPYTWFADTPEEAMSYAKLKSRGAHGDPRVYGGEPVVVEADIPDSSAWQLGSSMDMKAKYYKTSRPVRTRVTRVQ